MRKLWLVAVLVLSGGMFGAAGPAHAAKPVPPISVVLTCVEDPPPADESHQDVEISVTNNTTRDLWVTFRLEPWTDWSGYVAVPAGGTEVFRSGAFFYWQGTVVFGASNSAAEAEAWDSFYTVSESYNCDPSSDLCPNIQGIQFEVPDGYRVHKGECVAKGRRP